MLTRRERIGNPSEAANGVEVRGDAGRSIIMGAGLERKRMGNWIYNDVTELLEGLIVPLSSR
jgi:hypothetical protein